MVLENYTEDRIDHCCFLVLACLFSSPALEQEEEVDKGGKELPGQGWRVALAYKSS